MATPDAISHDVGKLSLEAQGAVSPDTRKPLSSSSESSNQKGPYTEAGGEASTDEGPCLRCDVCKKEHPPCRICYKVHHFKLCPYFHCVPKGAAFDPGYELICSCGNIFNDVKWACTFCGGSRPVIRPKVCTICNIAKKHSTYECQVDKVVSGILKSDREEQFSVVRKMIPYFPF